MRRIVLPLIALFVGIGVASLLSGQEPELPAPKHTIKDVMKQAHGAKLLNKVLDDSATDDEKKELLDLYISLVENQPPKGERGDWLRKTAMLQFAAARVVVGRENAAEALKAASNCKACHDAHK
jgi:hypothetical protein